MVGPSEDQGQESVKATFQHSYPINRGTRLMEGRDARKGS